MPPTAVLSKNTIGKGLLGQSSLYLLGSIARRALGFLLLPIYTHYLSPSDYGISELIELLVAVTTILLGVLALSDSITRIYFDYDSPSQRSAVISTGMVLAAALSGALVLVGSLASPLASQMLFHSSSQAYLIQWAFVSVLFTNVTEIGLAYQRIQLRAGTVVTFSCVQLVAAACLNVYFIAHLHLGVLGLILSKLISTGLGATYISLSTLYETGLRFEWAVVKSLSSFGGKLIITSLSFFAIHFSDRFFLASLTNTSQVGIYSLAYKFGFLITYLVGEPFGSAWKVRLFGQLGRDYWKVNAALTAKVLLLVLSLVAVLLSVFGKTIVSSIAAPVFLPAATLIPILTFSYVFREVGDFCRDILFVDKRLNPYTILVLATAFINIGLNYIFIHSYGIAGAAWSTFFTWGCYMVGAWTLMQRRYRLPIDILSVALLGLSSTVVVVLALAIGQCPPIEDLSLRSLLLATLAWGLWKAGYLSAKQFAELCHLFKAPLGVFRGVFGGVQR